MIQPIPQHIGVPATLPLHLLDLEPQIRTRNGLDRESLEGLAMSIRTHGVIQPVIVRESAEGRYVVVAGERRVLAASMAELSEIPVLIREGSAGDLRTVQAVENLQRENLSLSEIAEGLHALSLDPDAGTWANIARNLGKSPAWVSKHRSVLKLKPATREAMHQGLTSDVELLLVLDQIERIQTPAAEKALTRELEGLTEGTTTRASAKKTLQACKHPAAAPTGEPAVIDADDADDSTEDDAASPALPVPFTLTGTDIAHIWTALLYTHKTKPSSRPPAELLQRFAAAYNLPGAPE